MSQTSSEVGGCVLGFERFCEILLDGWSGASPKPSRTHTVFALLLAALCVTVFLIGVVPTYIYGHDDFFLLENGWRALHGQRPQLDYWSSWGPVISLVMAFGLKLAHESANGIGEANAVVALVIGSWAYWLGCKRLESRPRVLFALGAALLTCAPFTLGQSPLLSSHAMTYNRYGYALLSLVLLECLPLRRTTFGDAEELAGGISTGAVMAIALFLKASFFGASLPLVACSLLFGRRASRWLGLLCGFGLVAIVFMAYLRFDFIGVFRALRAAAGARSKSLSAVDLWWLIRNHVPAFAGVAMLGIGATLLKRGARPWIETIQWPLMGLILFVDDIALLATNAQGDALPLLSIFGLLVAAYLTERRQRSSPAELLGNLPSHIILLVLCSSLFLPTLAADVRGVAVAALHKARPPVQDCVVHFTVPRLSDLILCDHPDVLLKSSNGAFYTNSVSEGAALLGRHAGPADKVLTMDMQNPFPYVLGWAPTTGGMSSSVVNYTFSARFRPTPAQYFGDATVVMVPKTPAEDRVFFEPLYAIYGPDLLQRYRLAAEAGNWLLYRRK